MNILVAGELNVDLVLRNYSSFPTLGREVLVEDVSLTLGSASAICASALAKLGEHVSFIGKIGPDAWGDLCLKSLANAGVDCSFVIADSAIKTGITVSLTSAKDRALVTYLGSIAELRESDIRDKYFVSFGHLHVSSFYLQRRLRPDMKKLFARAHAHGLTTSLDPGFDPQDAWGHDLNEVLNEVDVFLPNEVELERLTGKQSPSDGLSELNNARTLMVAKLGAEGCMSIHNGNVTTVPAFPIQPVDTTGAGDTFNAGFLHAWLKGDSLYDAMRFGAACGALSTLGAGGTQSQPTEAQVRDFIAEHSSAQGKSEVGAVS
jgi:sugar/nucleoside kinase (ribokinase family)